MTADGPQTATEYLTYLAQNLSETSFELSELLYQKMKELELEITPLMMNYFLYNSAHFGQYKHLSQLLTEATICSLHVEINTYLKILTTLYFDYEVKFDRGEYILHVFNLLYKDHPSENSQLANDMLHQYVSISMEDFKYNQEKFMRNKKKAAKQAQNKVKETYNN